MIDSGADGRGAEQVYNSVQVYFSVQVDNKQASKQAKYLLAWWTTARRVIVTLSDPTEV